MEYKVPFRPQTSATSTRPTYENRPRLQDSKGQRPLAGVGAEAPIKKLIFIGVAGGFDGIDDLDVTGASAEVIGDSFTDFFPARVMVLHEQCVSGHDHTGDAVTALDGTFIDEGLLEGMQFTFFAFESFDGQNFFASGMFELTAAGAHGFAVDKDDAGAADTDVTAVFGAGQVEVFAQEFEKLVILTGIVHNMFDSVDCNFHIFLFHIMKF